MEENRTSTLDIYPKLGVKHIALVLLIRKHKALFLEFGNMQFEELKSGGRPTPVFYLTQKQIKFLILLMKNSEIALKLKKDFVKGM